MWLLSFFRHWMSSSAFRSCNQRVTNYNNTEYWGLVYNIESHNVQQDKIIWGLVNKLIKLMAELSFYNRKDIKELVHGEKY